MLHRDEFALSRCCCGRNVLGLDPLRLDPRGGNFVDQREIQEREQPTSHIADDAEIEDGTLRCVRPIKVKGLCPVTSDRISYRSCAKLPRKSLARFRDVPTLFLFFLNRSYKKEKKRKAW